MPLYKVNNNPDVKNIAVKAKLSLCFFPHIYKSVSTVYCLRQSIYFLKVKELKYIETCYQ